jgi:sRNA-binding carbon storage regulator CsrA
MLVLMLKKGDAVQADGPCVFELLERRGNGFRVGCHAPPTTKLLRIAADDLGGDLPPKNEDAHAARRR